MPGDGNIMLYVINEGQMNDARAYLKNSADMDLEFSKIADDYKTMFMPYKSGVPELSETEFIKGYAETVSASELPGCK